MNDKKFFAVAGYPVSRSKSPLIFNTLFNSMDIKASYSRVSARTADEAAYIFKILGLTGMNITSPLKSDFLELTDEIVGPSDIIGCINTISFKNGIIKGYNTDHSGVSMSFLENNIEISGKKCLVLGAGDAGKAAVYALSQMGGDVTIINRTFKKAHVLAGNMGCNAVVFDKLHSELSKHEILVSTISSGAELIKASWLNNHTIVLDAVYFSRSLAETAKKAGCFVIRGERWLLNQAVPAFKIFTGMDVPENELGKLSAILSKRNNKISGLELIGKDNIIENLKSRMQEFFKDLDITVSANQKNTLPGSKLAKKEIPFRVLIISGDPENEKKFFSAADLVISGENSVDDTFESLKLEIGHVL